MSSRPPLPRYPAPDSRRQSRDLTITPILTQQPGDRMPIVKRANLPTYQLISENGDGTWVVRVPET